MCEWVSVGYSEWMCLYLLEDNKDKYWQWLKIVYQNISQEKNKKERN